MYMLKSIKYDQLNCRRFRGGALVYCVPVVSFTLSRGVVQHGVYPVAILHSNGNIILK
jgi:hypothetical protein